MQKLQDDADDEEDEDYLYEGNDIDSDDSSFIEEGNDGSLDNDNDHVDDDDDDNNKEISNNINNNNNDDDDDYESSVEFVDVDCDELDDLLRDAGVDPISIMSSKSRKLRAKVRVEGIFICLFVIDLISASRHLPFHI